MADMINMGQILSRSPSNQYRQDSPHSHSWRAEEIADGLMSVDDEMGEVMMRPMTSSPNISFRARDEPKHKGPQKNFLIWVAFSRKYTPGIGGHQLQFCPVVECKKFIGNPEALRQHVYNCQDLVKGRYYCFECNKDVRIRNFHNHKSRKAQAGNGQPKRSKRSLRSNISSATRSLFSIHESNNYRSPVEEQTGPYESPRNIYPKAELFCEPNTFLNKLESRSITGMAIEKSASSDQSFLTDNVMNGTTSWQMASAQSYHQEISRRSIHGEKKDEGNQQLRDDTRDDTVDTYSPLMHGRQSIQEPYSTPPSVNQYPRHDYERGLNVASFLPMRNLSHTHQLSLQTRDGVLSPSPPCGNQSSDLPSPLTSPVDQREPRFIDQIVSPAGSFSGSGMMTRCSTATSLSNPSTNASISMEFDTLPVAGDSKSFIPMIEDSNMEVVEPEEMEEDIVHVPAVESELTQFMRHATVESCASALEENHWAYNTVLDDPSLGVEPVVPACSGPAYIDLSALTQTSGHSFDNTTGSLEEEWSAEENEAWYNLFRYDFPQNSSQKMTSDYFPTTFEGGAGGVVGRGPAELPAVVYPSLTQGPNEAPSSHVGGHLQRSSAPSQPVENVRPFHILKPAPPRSSSSDSTQSQTTALMSPTMTVVSTPSSTQSSGSDLDFKCPYCHHEPSGLQKNKKSNLKRHQKYSCPPAPIYIGKSKTYKCDYDTCDRRFTRPDALLVHRREERHEIDLDVLPPEHAKAFNMVMHEDAVQGGIYDGTGYGDGIDRKSVV